MKAETLVRNFRKMTGSFLAVLNVLLLAAAWGMALYDYPRIPATLAAPISLLGMRLGSRAKTGLLFLVPVVQTLLALAALMIGRVTAHRSRDARLGNLRREHLYLGLIFVNVIFIHLERNALSLAAVGQSSLNVTYLLALVAAVALVYVYYRLRRQSDGA